MLSSLKASSVTARASIEKSYI
jgi:hypothetical protein